MPEALARCPAAQVTRTPPSHINTAVVHHTTFADGRVDLAAPTTS
jgi:hypothetical protein